MLNSQLVDPCLCSLLESRKRSIGIQSLRLREVINYVYYVRFVGWEPFRFWTSCNPCSWRRILLFTSCGKQGHGSGSFLSQGQHPEVHRFFPYWACGSCSTGCIINWWRNITFSCGWNVIVGANECKIVSEVLLLLLSAVSKSSKTHKCPHVYQEHMDLRCCKYMFWALSMVANLWCVSPPPYPWGKTEAVITPL